MRTETERTVVFPWRDAYSVGIPQIDTQHEGLIRLINDLQTAMLAGTGKTAMAGIMDDLIRYTESHFAYEEAMLKQRGYSQLPAHSAEHKRLTGQVVELREKFRAGKVMVTVEVMKFLKDWLADHILSRDQAYAKELNSKA